MVEAALMARVSTKMWAPSASVSRATMLSTMRTDPAVPGERMPASTS
jgi:hypothetical protein